jgi:hypothetical protein
MEEKVFEAVGMGMDSVLKDTPGAETAHEVHEAAEGVGIGAEAAMVAADVDSAAATTALFEGGEAAGGALFGAAVASTAAVIGAAAIGYEVGSFIEEHTQVGHKLVAAGASLGDAAWDAVHPGERLDAIDYVTQPNTDPELDAIDYVSQPPE